MKDHVLRLGKRNMRVRSVHHAIGILAGLPNQLVECGVATVERPDGTVILRINLDGLDGQST